MKTHFLYGKTGINVDIPDKNIVGVVRKHTMPIVNNADKAIEEAIFNPIASLPLYELAEGKHTACIVVSDITRPVPNKLLLPPILRCLETAGISKDDITILIATGIHRPNLGDEMIELLGQDIVDNYRVINHYSQKMDDMSYLGQTSINNIPIYVNKYYVQSDLKIITGLIEPHFMAGYSGGRKSICPGISSIETVKYMHMPGILEHPKSDNCVVEGNPFHIEATEIAKKAGVDFVANVVIDENRQISGIFCGELEAAHAAGVAFADKYSRVILSDVSRPVDIVVTSTAGYPLDKTYYQTVKGFIGALNVIKDGGTIVMLSECSEGLGSMSFVDVLKQLKVINDYDAFIEPISHIESFTVDQWEVEELVKALKKVNIMLYSSDFDNFDLTFASKITSPEEGIARALEMHGEDAAILAIPEGPYVIPYLSSDAL
ncbi:nickel-dependent lactate racemase [Mahella sp.]|uniref:nickel-dependent lactate racemase n=1 Tax=Mahella sp. TaxID=2798721 RepID=UPI0025C1CD02|nr:nickel-dependent lactate racemase [Mahella sp.]MBZ4666558.1 hypothetical protein [Mahella sp.]MDK2903786.1 lactate racemase [Clostridiales bacterium]